MENTLSRYVTITGEWSWADFHSLLPAGVVLRIAAIPPTDPNGTDNDLIFWVHSKSVVFTTSSAYASFSHHSWLEPGKEWALVWKCAVHEKVRFFLWLALHNALLTNDVRHRRHIGNDLSCGLCGGEMEDLNHILRECPMSSLVWHDFLYRNQMETLLELHLNQWIVENLSNNTVFRGVGWSTFFATAVDALE
ncbi:hypothetical protein Scep_018496 [Stephania cephalantha]|uniref:Reverse transcriptase zinc-binding domain-containing protein n=1 Tax=Stephania cephalantha TaxID=152367 RepID=A0AAP0NK61_9MAGN